MPKKGYLYILASRRNGTLYVGVTSDLVKRIEEHRQKIITGPRIQGFEGSSCKFEPAKGFKNPSFPQSAGGNPIYPRMDARLRTSGMTITHLFSCSFVSQELISIPVKQGFLVSLWYHNLAEL